MSGQPGWTDAYATAATDLARTYDKIIAPMFAAHTDALLEAAAPQPGQTALDVACGPGTVTRPLAKRIGSTGSVIGADISPAMLDLARARDAEADAAPIRWIEAASGAIPLDAASIDVVVGQQGLQFFPDLEGALVELATLLRPGGVGVLTFWTKLADQPAYDAIRAALTRIDDSVATSFAQGPWGLGDSRERVHEAATDAGFAEVRIDHVVRDAAMLSPGEAVELLRATGVAAEVAALTPDAMSELIDAVSAEWRDRGFEAGEPTPLSTWMLRLRR